MPGSRRSPHQTCRDRPIARSNLTESLSSQLAICLSKNRSGPSGTSRANRRDALCIIPYAPSTSFLRKSFFFPPARHERVPHRKRPGCTWDELFRLFPLRCQPIIRLFPGVYAKPSRFTYYHKTSPSRRSVLPFHGRGALTVCPRHIRRPSPGP
jgi:hypothetical protein